MYLADSLSANCSSAFPTYYVDLSSAEDSSHNCSHRGSEKANLKTDGRVVGRSVGLADSGSQLAIPKNIKDIYLYMHICYLNKQVKFNLLRIV